LFFSITEVKFEATMKETEKRSTELLILNTELR
jgi:hypothetical protein